MFPSEKYVNEIKEKYPEGTRIQLDYMDDERAIEPGTKGTVDHVDDFGHIHTKWDNGRTFVVVPDDDKFHKVTERNRDDGAR